MKKIIILSLTVLGQLISGCTDSGKKIKTDRESEKEVSETYIELTKKQFENSAMALGGLEEKTFPITVQANGIIDVPPENRAVVNATMGGYIKSTPLLIGNTVKKGQMLVTIENPEFVELQQDYMEVKQQLAYLKSEYERQKTLMEENITSQKSFLKAESEYQSANARYNGLRKQLQMLNISPSEVEKGTIVSLSTIFAPIGGSITKINVSKGTYVSPASPILEIIDNDHIHLELMVFEKDILKIKKGQRIVFKIPEASEAAFEAEVYLIGTSIGENRTIKIHGHLKDEKQNNFLTGMFVNASIVTGTITALALPSTAIVEADGKKYVLRVKEKLNDRYVLEQVEVKAENETNGFISIGNIENLSQKDQFLAKGAFNLMGE